MWACVGVLLGVQALAMVPEGATTGFKVWVVSQQFARAAFWMLLTPWLARLRRRWPCAGPWRYLHLAGHLALSLVLMFVFWAARVPVFRLIGGPPLDGLHDLLLSFNLRNFVDVVLYWSTLVGVWVYELMRAEERHAVNESELRARLAETELGALRQQVQPHFLFNALNAISALVRLDRRPEAVQALAQLSALQRSLLESAGVPAVPLAQEIAFVERYLAIERLRFGERLVARVVCDPAAAELPVPNLLLQPLVENAVKHGVARRTAPCRVEVSVERRADTLRLIVRNDPPDADQAAAPGTGFGLRGTRQRLERLHGARARVDFAVTADAVTVTLELPLPPAAP